MLPLPIPSKDSEHLRALAICHYVHAVFTLLATLFLIWFQRFTEQVLSDQKKIVADLTAFTNRTGQQLPPIPDLEQQMEMLQSAYQTATAFGLLIVICSFVLGRFMQRRTHRSFSIVAAACLCFAAPFGTILGILTILVLTRESVMRLYAAAKSGPVVEPVRDV
ncbi:MAG: hypothetical protein R3F13_06065 [Prosthecobacter sp.]